MENKAEYTTDTTNLTDLEKKALTFVMELRDPVTAGIFSSYLGTTKIKEVIHSLRKKGYPICAGRRGYWYAKTKEELQEFIESLDRRILSLKEASAGLSLGLLILKSGVPVEAPKFYKTLPVQLPNEHVRYEKFELDGDGAPIIPPDMEGEIIN